MKAIALLIVSVALAGCAQTLPGPIAVPQPALKQATSSVAPQASVDVAGDTTGRRIRVKVTGEVQRPGAFLLPADATVADAVAAASGMTRLGWWGRFGSELVHEGSSEHERFDERTPAGIEGVKKIRLRDGDTVHIGGEAY